ncbi:hypothetical protein [Brevibacillus massiliensis]|uniref:hypothetical protein n=1 Tax=Brevibacillus massiliensis TaxID=1118054 RepID=UPI0002EFCE3B|nr:hypothetical protein [Brevibacillus massiliensis]
MNRQKRSRQPYDSVPFHGMFPLEKGVGQESFAAKATGHDTSVINKELQERVEQLEDELDQLQREISKWEQRQKRFEEEAARERTQLYHAVLSLKKEWEAYRHEAK